MGWKRLLLLLLVSGGLSWLAGPEIVLKACVIIGCMLQLVGTVAVIIHSRRRELAGEPHLGRPGETDYTPPLTILKPVKGIDEGAAENFASHLRQDYPTFEVIFCVQDPDDPVVPLIRRVLKAHPQVDARLLVDSTPLGANGKVANLNNGLRHARYRHLLMTDSDVRVDPRFARRMVRPLSDKGTGLTFPLPMQRGYCNLAAAFEAVTMNHDSATALSLLHHTKGLSVAFGPAIAMRRSFLEEELGGFDAMKDLLAEDHWMGNKAAELGFKVHLVREPTTVVFRKQRWRDVLRHIFRWSRTQRLVEPRTFDLFPLAYAIPPALLLSLLAPITGLPWLAAALAIRVSAVVLTDLLYIREASLYRYLWLIPLKDLLSPLVWAASYLGDTVEWRGRRLKVRPDGTMLLKQEADRLAASSSPGR